MCDVTDYAEFRYRRAQQELDKCRRIAQKMLDTETSEAKKMCATIALESWLAAGNGRKEDEK